MCKTKMYNASDFKHFYDVVFILHKTSLRLVNIFAVNKFIDTIMRLFVQNVCDIFFKTRYNMSLLRKLFWRKKIQ